MDQVDMTDIKQDGDKNPFDTLFAENDKQEKETSAASSAETKPEEQAPSQEGADKLEANVEGEKPEAKAEKKSNTSDVNQNVPLNKDRRFKEVLEHNKALEKRLQDMQTNQEKLFSELKSSIGGAKSTPKEVPAAFKELFGEGNEHLWEKWQSLYPQQPQINVDEIKSQLLAELEAKQQAEAETQKQRLAWVDSELQKLKDDGLKFDKNELLQVLETYQPTNAEGVLDFQKGYKLLELINKTKPENQRRNARKEVAAKTSPRGGSEPVADDVVDLAKIRGTKNWRDLVKY